MNCIYLIEQEVSSILFLISKRFLLHNGGKVPSTKYGIPWEIVWYCAFKTEREARDFERYLKSGSGKSFAYKRLLSVVLAKDFGMGRKGSPKLKAYDTLPFRLRYDEAQQSGVELRIATA